MTTAQVFDRIVQEQGAMIKRIASSYEAERHLAEELVQDIYLAIWRALPSFRGNSQLRTFVARIATNRAVTHVKRALKLPISLEVNEAIPATGESPESHAIALDEQSKLTAAVRRLPLSYRQTAMLTLEGLTPKEIGDVLGITANAVSIRMARAKELLRILIGDRS
jgi:RNA polymerase sigma-70 factor (ECF subfamily)